MGSVISSLLVYKLHWLNEAWKTTARGGAIWKATTLHRKAGILSVPEVLNGLIFESKSAAPAMLIVIDSMAGILYSYNDGKIRGIAM